jgi:hypothetical protein
MGPSVAQIIIFHEILMNTCRGLIPRVPRDAGYGPTLKLGSGHAQATGSRTRGLPVLGL